MTLDDSGNTPSQNASAPTLGDARPVATREVEDCMRLFVDTVRDQAIVLMDPQGHVTSWNKGAERINGYAPREIIGSHVSRLYAPEDVQAGKPERDLELARAEGRYEEEGWKVRKDGSRYWVNVVITALVDEGGRLRGFGKVIRDITERKLAEAVLRESEERTRLFVDAVRDYAIIFLTRDGRVASWNDGAERILGWHRDEVLGRHFSVFYPKEKAGSGAAEAELRCALETGRYEEEGVRVRKDGTPFIANVVLTAVRDGLGSFTGFVKVTQDVTERKRIEEELRLSEESFRLLVESVRDYAIFTLDPDGVIASWNPGAERIKGYAPEEIIGRHFSTFYTEEDLRSGKPARELEIARREGRYEEEGWRVRKDGTTFWANVVISVQVDGKGRIRGYSKVTRDMTERKAASDAMKALADRLLRSNRELEHFASIASHDLQEPLRKIQSFGDQLRLECGEELGEDGRFYLERMTAASQRMRSLIEDLLAFSRVGTQPAVVREVDMGAVVKDVLADLDLAVRDSRAVVEVGELPVVVAAVSHMRQLMQNLLGNALKFHRPGVVPRVTVTASADEAKRRWIIRVTDNGIGFDPKYGERIFDLFQRLHSRDEFAGSGLGLSICRRIVDHYGGGISAESAPGQGATFLVEFPFAATPDRDGAPLPMGGA